MERRKFRFKKPEELGDSYFSFFPRSIYLDYSVKDYGYIVEYYNTRGYELSYLTQEDIEDLIERGFIEYLSEIDNNYNSTFPIRISSHLCNNLSGFWIHEHAIVWDYSNEELQEDINQGKFSNLSKLFNMIDYDEN